MDYTTQSLSFKISKTLRYVKLYGLRRTWAKVRGQYHMKQAYDVLPQVAEPPPEGGHVGLIGCGNFAYSNIACYLRKNYGRVIRAAADIDINKAASLYQAYGLRYYSADADRIINDPAIDLIYIASNHSTHVEYAVEALQAGKNVHIEKPHVVNIDQLIRLCRAIQASSGKVALGFNRPMSRTGIAIKKYLDSQDGPTMLNWFVAGHKIAPDHWYFREEEGGRILGNLCHWTDFVLWLIAPEDRYPITITPTSAEKSDSDIAVTYVFGDGSIAAITFSAKGHTFEGVRERFAAHRADVLISMDDFHDLKIEVVDKKYNLSSFLRDHGHEQRIKRSYEMVRPGGEGNPPCSLEYVWETGELFLATKQALENDEKVVLHAFDESRLAESAPVG